MSLGDEYRLLATIPPFEVLDIARLKLLAFASDRLTYQAGQILVRQERTHQAYEARGFRPLLQH